jgi:tRNA-dihydrouridine synthase B
MSVLPKNDLDKPRPSAPAPELADAPWNLLGKPAREFTLGPLKLNGRVFLAPMAGYTDTAFRRLARRYGAAMVVTEMVSARGLIAGNNKSNILMEFTESERPVSVQLFGGEPAIMGEAARRVMNEVHPDVIDVNFGCPVGKVLRGDAGSSLLKEPQRAGWIVEAMVKATEGKVPITVKTRAGFDAKDNAVFELLEAVESAGAAALAIHARTRSQMFEGKADWEIITRIKQKAGIPIIGNGDVRRAEDAYHLFRQTNCDGIMIGRGSIGAPWIFEEINHYLETGKPMRPPSLKSRAGMALEQLQCSIEVKGEHMGLLEMRKHLTHYFRGFVGAKEMRQSLLTSNDSDFVLKTLADIHASLPAEDAAGSAA